MSYEVVHLTTVHPRSDTRILIKECSSLARKYKLALIVADGLGGECKNGINIFDIGKFNGRLNRVKNASKAMYLKAIDLDAKIYHVHDPELIPVGLKLKKAGKKVIFDAHEDLPKQILTKHYLNPLVKKILSTLIEFYERKQCCKFDGIVAATPYIRDKFKKINKNVVDINNFPVVDEFFYDPNLFNSNPLNSVCYVGAIDIARGVGNNIEALPTDGYISLLLAGRFSNDKFHDSCRKQSGWENVKYYGFADRKLVQEIFSNSFAGLVTLLPMPSYLDSLPVKMFEYMAYGLPVIASDFPYWREIIEKYECGICVDPCDVNAIRSAISLLSSDLQLCKNLGNNGRKAVLEIFNWDKEEEKLFDFYLKLLNET
ncbi:glycosyltransferase [Acinetobacter halotolerans]|uniref:Glycosyltransferase n=1 Tax=Acinetobacter halotolerans TaxID=1752076 RepID=A0A4Q6X7T6_9GAMM|nr:glycosyltransferase [Acinetobacter halotolerans]RZF51150.1 glycosyltransferase [Acinetobacter halotolerans]